MSAAQTLFPSKPTSATERARRAAYASHAQGRRRRVDPTTCERDYAADEIEFMAAMDRYKRESGRMFPTWSEVLEVLKDLGYERPEQAENTTSPAR